MNLSRYFLLSIFLVSTHLSFAQNEFSKWYFGNKAGLDFSTNPPTALTNGSMVATEGCASISDASGNLLFYTNGIDIYNSSHAIMDNGSGLNGHQSSTQSAIVVKQPGTAAVYYVFTTGAGTFNPACYSIVDMSLSSGQGSVTVKNAVLYPSTCEKQVAVRHCNGQDIWIISHGYGNSNFLAYRLGANGINLSPMVSSISQSISTTGETVGQLKISPDGRKLAMATSSTNLGSFSGFQLFDFDPATGLVANSLTLVPHPNAYSLEFSPDGTKLYGLNLPPSTILYQWNICAPSASAIVASQYTVGPLTGSNSAGGIQRAINNKIYIGVPGGDFLHVINNPNASGAAMSFSLGAVSTNSRICQYGFPNYINTFTKPLPGPFTKTISCQTGAFSAPPAPTTTTGCAINPYAYTWNFGDPASGTANTSTVANPSHLFSGTGTYSVSLILYGNCVNDTLRQTVNVSTLGPTVSVAGNFTVCKGDKYTYTASGANTYQWFNNSTASTLALAPSTTTVYAVSGTLNGCTLSKSFTVTVNPCTGIEKQQQNSGFQVFPNPFKESLSIESEHAAELSIIDVKGNLLLKQHVEKGHTEINSSLFTPGIYFVQLKNSENVWRGRFVKVAE